MKGELKCWKGKRRGAVFNEETEKSKNNLILSFRFFNAGFRAVIPDQNQSKSRDTDVNSLISTAKS